jgi:hypothetical protein
MGSWDVDAFGNDSACDWAADFAETGTPELVTEELEDALGDWSGGSYRPEVLVACEVVARLQGRWGTRDAYSEKLDAWVLRNPIRPSDELIVLATEVIDKILTNESELAPTWVDSRSADAWRAGVLDLRRRVSGEEGE